MSRKIIRMKIYRSVIIVVLLTVLVCSIVLLISYEDAKGVAFKYLQIVNYNKETYPEMKGQLYDIVTPETQKLLFGNEPKSLYLPPIKYSVNSIRGKIIGYNQFVFKVNWTLNNSATIDSVICIKNRVVYDAYRVD